MSLASSAAVGLHGTPWLLDRRRWALLTLLYLLLVVYASLVPLEWRGLPWSVALERFRAIPLLELGAGSRADWIANILLYLPLGFGAAMAFLGLHARGLVAAFGALLILVCCIAVAVAVEFTQLFFPPRTVSQNDLIAETIGAAGGIALWALGRWRVLQLAAAVARGGRASVVAAAVLFGLLYLFVALFPFDFVIAWSELEIRLARARPYWLLGPPQGWLRGSVMALAEVIAAAPLGLFLTLLWPRLQRPVRLLLVGMAVGLVIESLQLLLFSGSSRLLSVLLPGLGVASGGWLGGWLARPGQLQRLGDLLWRAVPLLILPYAWLLAALAGWFGGPWLRPAAAMARLPELGWVPLYYHYWTTEPQAVASLLAVLAMYMPIGLAGWARGMTQGMAQGMIGRQRRPRVWPVLLAALVAVFLIEAGKLFAPAARPDPSNLFIAPAGAWLALVVAGWFTRVMMTEPPRETLCGRSGGGSALASGSPAGPTLSAARARVAAPSAGSDGPPGRSPGPPPAVTQSTAEAQRPMTALGATVGRGDLPVTSIWPRPRLPLPPPRPFAWGLTAVAAVALLAGAWGYPLAAPWSTLGLALLGLAWALLCWHAPWCALVALPAALPVLDLSVLTGQRLLDEFDLLLLATLAGAGLRLGGLRPARWPHPWLPVAVSLLWLTWLVATLRGLGPLSPATWSLAASHPPLAAWLVGKGLLWALLLVPLLRRLRRAYGSALSVDLWLHGTVLGLGLTTLVVLWERHVHVGLLDLTSGFRITGPFTSMHTGGAYIEAYLALALPCLWVWTGLRRARWARLLGALLILLGSYAMLVTFARAGYAALLVAAVVLLVGLRWSLRARRQWRAWVLPLTLLLVAAMIAIPAANSGFARLRLEQSRADLAVRLQHWSAVIDLLGGRWEDHLLGVGFGRYPALSLLEGHGARPPGSFAVLDRDGTRFVRFGAGTAIYLDQWVGAHADTDYRVTARLRAPTGEAGELRVALCQKALLYSFTCRWARLPVAAGADWVEVEARIASGPVGRSGNWPYGPVKLSLYHPGGLVLDLAQIRLLAPDGRDLVANGDFAHGAARWLFTVDQRTGWHIDQHWLEVYLAQGALGVLAQCLLLLALAMVLVPAVRAGRLSALALAAGLAGFLTVGLVGSTMDSARMLWLFYATALAGALLVRGDLRTQVRRRARRRTSRRDQSLPGTDRETGRGTETGTKPDPEPGARAPTRSTARQVPRSTLAGTPPAAPPVSDAARDAAYRPFVPAPPTADDPPDA